MTVECIFNYTVSVEQVFNCLDIIKKGNEMGNCGNVCDCDVIHEDKVAVAKQSLLDDDVILSLADFFKILSDSTRVKIVSILEKHELCVCDIANILNMTKSAVSHQLKNLKDMNLVKARKIGKEVWYALADEHISKIFDITFEHINEARNG